MKPIMKNSPDDDVSAMAKEVSDDLRKIDHELRGKSEDVEVPEITEVGTLGLKLTRLSNGNARLCITKDGPDAEPETCTEGTEETAEEIMALLKKVGLVE